MEKLHPDWITEGLIDFEYKKYQLLAYLKGVKERFKENRLYPDLSDMVMHFNNLMTIKDQKALLFEHFPKTISKIDFQKLKLTYERILADDELMTEIYDVINYAIPRMQHTIEEGKELHESVEKNLEFEVVGVLPLYDNEGYLFLAAEKEPDVLIYQYQVSIYTNATEKFRAINTQFVTVETRNLVNTFENIKLNLIKNIRELPNPATYLVLAKNSYPVQETLLPIAKRILVRHIRFAA